MTVYNNNDFTKEFRFWICVFFSHKIERKIYKTESGGYLYKSSTIAASQWMAK